MFNSYTFCRLNKVRSSLMRTMLLIVCLATCSVSLAQLNNRPEYQLLWRINGPGMQAPSYIFGTMHLTDNRVFDFSDSVLTSLRSSRSFAMEVDMDSLMAYMFSPNGPLQDSVNHMRKLLNPDEYRYVDSLILEKTGSTIDKLKVKRLWLIEKLLFDNEEMLREAAPDTSLAKNQKNVFLDAWFHQKATGLGKPVHSLEKLENQLGYFRPDPSEFQKEAFLWDIGYRGLSIDADKKDSREGRMVQKKDQLNSMVDLYYNGDLKEIDREMNDHENDLEMISRNREMTANLNTLISKGSVFAAVGVAHLPGKSGMLALLRKKGFSVEPVNATFTSVAKRERQMLDSLKGYPLTRISDGYSVVLPGPPISIPIPNTNRYMYIGTANEEVGFAFCIDIPKLASDNEKVVKDMLKNMAESGKAEIQKSYPITYRNMPGTEAIMFQNNLHFKIRVFIVKKRVFLFMFTGEASGNSTKEFFESVRFYDIVHPVIKYDTLYRQQEGFSVILPADANHLFLGKETTRPEEAYTAIDNSKDIAYEFRVVKIKSGYYNTSDKSLLTNIQKLMLRQDSTMQMTDSVVTTLEGLPRYQFTYKYGNGYLSQLHYIPRGNLAYALICTYDGNRTDSSIRQRYFNTFKIFPLQSKTHAVPFMGVDSSFTVMGPEKFTGGVVTEQGNELAENLTYSAMDSATYSMFTILQTSYSPYYQNNPDTLLHSFLHPDDSAYIKISGRQFMEQGRQVYEMEHKGMENGLRIYRKAIVAGRNIYRLNAIVPEELSTQDYSRKFFNSFQLTGKALADTVTLGQSKLNILLHDLQSTDTLLFKRANDYLGYFYYPDSADSQTILTALNKPFPADTALDAKVTLLTRLKNVNNNAVVDMAEKLFDQAPTQRNNILSFLCNLNNEYAIRAFLRLAEKPSVLNFTWENIFSYTFKEDSLYYRYMPEMVAIAGKSPDFLQSFVTSTYGDSLWLTPQFSKYKLESLVPKIEQLFKQKLQEWKIKKKEEDSSWIWERSLLTLGHVLALPGMKAAVEGSFRELLADSLITLKALGARGLISRGIKVNDKVFKSILADYGNAHLFITALDNQKQIKHIRHLLNQEETGRSYLAYYLTDDNVVKDVRYVTRVKVQCKKEPAAWLFLYRYQIEGDDEWYYALNGLHPLDSSKLNFNPDLIFEIEKETATDKSKLEAEAQKACENYFEESEE